MKNARLSNIELCRLIAIVLVLIVHTTTRSIGAENCTSFGMLFMTALSVIGVNVFVLITGYFSVTPKKISLLQLAFVCFFWCILKLICYKILGEPISYSNFFFITDSNWFIPSYICLLFIAPFLNKAFEVMSQKQLLGGAFLLLLIRTWFDWIPPYPSIPLGNLAGHSVLSFVILYIIGRYVKLYGVPRLMRNYAGTIYLLMTICTATLAWVSIRMGLPLRSVIYSYNSPFIILSALSFFLMFERKQYNSSVINYLAKSVISILLGHSAIFIWYTAQYKYLYFNYSGVLWIGYWLLSLMIVLSSCVLIDQIRIFLWEIIAKYLLKHIKNNDIFDSLSEQK